MPDWRALSGQAGFKVLGNELTIAFEDGRRHKVVVEERPDQEAIRLWAVAVRPSALPDEPEGPQVLAWTRNRSSDLVGFKIDGRGRLVGEAWAPTAGLSFDEWANYVRAVAQSCDRIEYLLTGRDEE
jgi:hypothetical protein